MVLSNAQMLSSIEVLSQLEEKGMLGYAIARNRQKLLAELVDYANKRDELAKEYGKDKGNGQYQFDSESGPKFLEALKPYSDLTVDVAVMRVSPDVFCGGNLTSQQMYILSWMVEE